MRALLFLGAVAVTLAGVATADTGAWQELLTVDCAGGVHLLSSSFLASSFNLEGLEFAVNQYFDNIASRARCACPDIADEEIMRRFVPSMEMLLGMLDADVDNTASECPNAFTEKWFDNSIFADGAVDLQMDILPRTCSYADYVNGEPCAVQMNEPVSDTNLQILTKKCYDPTTGDDTHTPFVSITCEGGLCDGLFKPCQSGGSDDQCGHELLTCTDVLDGDTLEELLMSMGLIGQTDDGSPNDDLDSCGGGGSFVDSIANKLAQFWSGVTGTLSGGTLAVCMPRDDDGEEIAENTVQISVETDMKAANDAAFAACYATGCDTPAAIGDGHCDPICNNAECKFDGGDCKNSDDHGCPTNTVGAECSGNGWCMNYDDVDDDFHGGSTNECSCRSCWQSDSSGNYNMVWQFTGNDCSAFTGSGSAPTTYESQKCYGDDEYMTFNADAAFERVVVTNVQGKGLLAWDGVLADGGAADSIGRLTGNDFGLVDDTASAADGTPLLFFHGAGGFGGSLFNPHLAMAFKAHNMQVGLDFLMEEVVMASQSCRAQARGVTELTPAQFMTRFLPYKLAWSLYQWSTPIDMELGSDALASFMLMEHPDGEDHFRFQSVGSCTHDSVVNDGSCHMEYTGFSELLDATMDVFVSTTRDTAFPYGFDYWGMGAKGDVPDILRQPTSCTTDTDCATGLRCTDIGGPDYLNIDEVFEEDDERDPLGNILFGGNNFGSETCSSTAKFRNSLRNLIRSLGDQPPDDGTDLKFCFIDVSSIGDRVEDWASDRIEPGCLEHIDGSGNDYSGDDNWDDFSSQECAPGCPDYWINDDYCDSDCYNAACNYDGSDCDDYCQPGCHNDNVGDGHCQASCNNGFCSYDAGDCDGDNSNDDCLCDNCAGMVTIVIDFAFTGVDAATLAAHGEAAVLNAVSAGFDGASGADDSADDNTDDDFVVSTTFDDTEGGVTMTVAVNGCPDWVAIYNGIIGAEGVDEAVSASLSELVGQPVSFVSFNVATISNGSRRAAEGAHVFLRRLREIAKQAAASDTPVLGERSEASKRFTAAVHSWLRGAPLRVPTPKEIVSAARSLLSVESVKLAEVEFIKRLKTTLGSVGAQVHGRKLADDSCVDNPVIVNDLSTSSLDMTPASGRQSSGDGEGAQTVDDIPPADDDSTYVVAQTSLPMSANEFNEDAQQAFKNSVSVALSHGGAGVSSTDIFIISFDDDAAARRRATAVSALGGHRRLEGTLTVSWAVYATVEAAEAVEAALISSDYDSVLAEAMVNRGMISASLMSKVATVKVGRQQDPATVYAQSQDPGFGAASSRAGIAAPVLAAVAAVAVALRL